MKALALWVLMVLLTFGVAEAKQSRSQSVKTAFVKTHPCPATHRSKLPCKGYIIDHVTPLCAGGADHPSNLQWQTVADAKRKDREEKKLCASHRARRH